MSIKVEAGRRFVQVETEVPGTPEQVWQAIATGAGISAWFVPATVEERLGGKMVLDMGPGMESQSIIKVWEPLRRFAAENPGWAPGMPSISTEWTIEARAGGTCIVRVVHSLFASTADWDNQLEGTETGWPVFFRILRLYLAHFAGQRCANIQVMAMAADPGAKAWKSLTSGLGFEGAREGERRSASGGSPQLAGTVEGASEGKGMSWMLVRLEKPAAGTLSLGAYACGGQAMVSVSFFLYGEGAEAVAKREEPLWQAWLAEKFPAPAEAAAP